MNLQEEIEKRLRNSFVLVLVFKELLDSGSVKITVLADGIQATRYLPKTRDIQRIEDVLDSLAKQVDDAAKYLEIRSDQARLENAVRNYQNHKSEAVAIAEASRAS